MSGIQIDLKRTGFPVKIGALELWFDSSLENLKNFFNIEEVAQERLKESQEKAKHIHFPDGFEEYELDDYTEEDIKNVNAAFDVNKEFVAVQYDIIFGDGTFKKIYEQYPDILALEQALEPLGVAISKKIDEQEEERSKQIEKKKNEYLNKKKAKN